MSRFAIFTVRFIMRALDEPIARLRIAGVIEGMTLLLLVGVAMPLKRLGGFSEAVAMIGPIHGVAFTLYLVLLLESVASGGWRIWEVLRAVIVSLIPFGTFFNDPMLKQKDRALRGEAVA